MHSTPTYLLLNLSISPVPTATAYIKILEHIYDDKINTILLRYCKFSGSITLAWGRKKESEMNSMNLERKLIRGSLFVINYTGTKLDFFFFC